MSNSNEQRIERAYRLAQWPLIVAGHDADREMSKVWAEAVDKLHHPERHTSNKRLIHDLAILALALVPRCGCQLGRWYADDTLTGWQFYLGDSASENGRSAYRTFSMGRAYWGGVTLAPGAYLDGTASELLLLMAAADELARREVQP